MKWNPINGGFRLFSVPSPKNIVAMKLCSVILTAALSSLPNLAFAQGFSNLDFEKAQIVFNGYSLSVSNAFPGWTVTAPYIVYDTVSLSGNSIAIWDTNSPYNVAPIHGKYFVALAGGNTPGLAVPISLGQTGTIPLGTESMTFWGNIGNLQITFGGQSLAFSEIGSTANYNIYGANISQFAGDTGQLLFSLPPYAGSATLDNIQFSTSQIPEPAILGLFGLGSLAFLWHRRKAKAIL
jgi:hypothetical protein